MAVNQFIPLEVNHTSNEPFLRLHKHKNIILTPARWEDAPLLVPFFNDPSIHEWLLSPPVPFHLDDAIERLKRIIPAQQSVISVLKNAELEGSQSPVIVGGPPVSMIRQLGEDGTEALIGNIVFRRCMGEIMESDPGGWEAKEKNEKANNALEVGDPGIVWSMGFFLAPSHHGQGIMTDALETLMQAWAIPRMNARRFLVGAFSGNHGSIRVFEKTGFVRSRLFEDFAVVRGRKRDLQILRYDWVEESSESKTGLMAETT